MKSNSYSNIRKSVIVHNLHLLSSFTNPYIQNHNVFATCIIIECKGKHRMIFFFSNAIFLTAIKLS